MSKVRNRVNLKLLIWFLFPLIVVILTGCKGKVSSDPPEGTGSRLKSGEEVALNVEVVKLKKEKVTPQFLSFGNISFKSKTDISSAVDGVVKRIYRDVGDRVSSGTVLATIENIQLRIEEKRTQADVQSAQAALSLARAKLSEGELQVKVRFLDLEKKKLQIEQKKTELDELKRIVRNKEDLLKVDGITKEKLDALKMQYKSGVASYNMLLKDYAIQSIGLTDEYIEEALKNGALKASSSFSAESGLSDERVFPAATPLKAVDPEAPEASKAREKLLIHLNTRTLQAEVKVAEARLEAAKTKLSSVQTLLSELEVNSDYAGIVGARYVEAGERIKTGTKLFTTFDSSTVYAVFPIQEDKAGFLGKGQSVKITVPALGKRIFNGVVDIISPTIDSQSGNVNVKALFKNRSENMLPGMFVRVSVITGKPVYKLLLPLSSIVKKQAGNAQVFTVVNGRAFLKRIVVGEEERPGSSGEGAEAEVAGKGKNTGRTTGAVSGIEKIEVKEGLKEGEVVIVRPPPILREGMPVKY